MTGGIKFISYIERHVINLAKCTFEQWNDFVIHTWQECHVDEIPLTKDNWDKAEHIIIDNLPEGSYNILANNPNGII